MARKRKYPEVKGYWVYSIKIPSNGKFYIGVSKCKKCSQRWHKAGYVGTALEQYLDEWQDMIKTVLIDGLNKQDAFIYEGKIIDALKMNDLCINSNRSGLIEVSDANAYHRELLKNNLEYHEHHNQLQKQYHKQRYTNNPEYQEQAKQRAKQYYENNKEKILERQKQYYEKNKEKISEKRRQRRLKKKQQDTVVH